MDWNNDGKQDLISGDSLGQVWLFLNEGTPKEPRLRTGVKVEAGGKAIVGVAPRYEQKPNGNYERVPNTKDVIGIYSKIHMADWDGDGLKDLLVGQDGPGDQQILLYRNTGKPGQPVLDEPTVLKLPGPAMSRPSPYLVDWDGDGQVDVLCGTESAKVYFFKNVSAGGEPKLSEGVPVDLQGDGFDKGYRCRIHVTDWNNDGKQDLLVGNFLSVDRKTGGNVWLFLSQ